MPMVLLDPGVQRSADGSAPKWLRRYEDDGLVHLVREDGDGELTLCGRGLVGLLVEGAALAGDACAECHSELARGAVALRRRWRGGRPGVSVQRPAANGRTTAALAGPGVLLRLYAPLLTVHIVADDGHDGRATLCGLGLIAPITEGTALPGQRCAECERALAAGAAPLVIDPLPPLHSAGVAESVAPASVDTAQPGHEEVSASPVAQAQEHAGEGASISTSVARGVGHSPPRDLPIPVGRGHV